MTKQMTTAILSAMTCARQKQKAAEMQKKEPDAGWEAMNGDDE